MIPEQLIGRSSSLHYYTLTSVVRIMPCCDSVDSAYPFCPTWLSCTSAPFGDSALSHFVLARIRELVTFTSTDREAKYPCPLVLRSHVLWNKGRKVGTQAAIITMFCSTLLLVSNKSRIQCLTVYAQAPENERHRIVYCKVSIKTSRFARASSHGSTVSVKRWRYAPLMIVTIAESMVILIRTHIPILVDRFI